LLPAGRLREPVSALRRADAVVRDMSENEMKELAAHGLSAEVWKTRRELAVDDGAGLAVAFCGIARAQQFFLQLQEKVTVLGTLSFPDHHRYSAADIERLLELKAFKKADCFVTTEKDEVNLGDLAGRLQPLRIARLKMTLEDPTSALKLLLWTLEQRCSCRF
jgi:tetraacyldisaccharide 4'-kinase